MRVMGPLAHSAACARVSTDSLSTLRIAVVLCALVCVCWCVCACVCARGGGGQRALTQDVLEEGASEIDLDVQLADERFGNEPARKPEDVKVVGYELGLGIRLHCDAVGHYFEQALCWIKYVLDDARRPVSCQTSAIDSFLVRIIHVEVRSDQLLGLVLAED